ncbi:SDR family NAD(P)-dependent oxidoreductase [Cohnella endophytica]|uniref:SDR family NAD(P)-dependent oxidoreductase n=1 Tax=Cohnella endophytica TaxID=2419778 RepID=A0A494XU41_9BACL|nr:SDR family NAD(P)-dependent oxidoreductase [Cohnella endophytica]RKP53191.1 SDR family NAD(P)-dependent oxidoreductase [Cohnella endophytica]
MRVLVTGASGFVGTYLVMKLAERGHQVYACMRNRSNAFQEPVNNLFFDLSDESMLFDAMEIAKPEGVIHLAAQSEVRVAWADPMQTLITNAGHTVTLLKSIIKLSPYARVITVGSSEEYGWTGKLGAPLTEEDACLPQNPYATSKLAAGQLALQIASHNDLNLIHARPFNHFGPGQREGFVISDFASQIARIESLKAPPIIRIGNLSAERDFTDVRDVVDAYIKLLETETGRGVYNICSGKPIKIKEILDFFVLQSRLPIEIQSDPSKFRKSEVPLFVGSSNKLVQATGWKPIRDFENSLTETLDWWRRGNVIKN